MPNESVGRQDLPLDETVANKNTVTVRLLLSLFGAKTLLVIPTQPKNVLYCALLRFTALYYTALYCTLLHCTILHCTAHYCTVLYCTVLHITALYYTALFCRALHCAVLTCKYLYSTDINCKELHFIFIYSKTLNFIALGCSVFPLKFGLYQPFWLLLMDKGVLQLVYLRQLHLMGGLASPQTHQALDQDY